MPVLDGDCNVCFSSLISRVWALLTARRISIRSKSSLDCGIENSYITFSADLLVSAMGYTGLQVDYVVK